jgi:hypothetical protein
MDWTLDEATMELTARLQVISLATNSGGADDASPLAATWQEIAPDSLADVNWSGIYGMARPSLPGAKLRRTLEERTDA